ncbi:hypothetical protein CEUSTIGMA_g12747.t1 [Chlamydomonas eustigma]|uniref:Ubiquitin-like protease family profile domain-containing protein n=1 Tax=Chlamydomonas eustigma TaxID=1157962 RepID=A0A250XR94_9CHLO|nr:hypothetical protein CEUSTIGMA_g12747.t1 [Chlamydomonas eustigma]|eukprot:GAX85330.1 hypothetical protein CEUSTIGMA_g12747.t1 [Chlamydomonas eustigma]
MAGCLVIVLSDKTVTIYDSIEGKDYTREFNDILEMIEYINSCMDLRIMERDTWKLQCAEVLAAKNGNVWDLQDNTFDCRIFMVMYALHLYTGSAMAIKKEKMSHQRLIWLDRIVRNSVVVHDEDDI